MSNVAGRPPPLSPGEVCKLITRHFGIRNAVKDSVKEFPSYDDANYYVCGESVNSVGAEFVLKLYNPLHTSLSEIRSINKLMRYVSFKGYTFSTPCPVLSTSGRDLLSLTKEEIGCLPASGDSVTSDENSAAVKDSIKYPVCLLSFIPGEMFDKIEKRFLTPVLLKEVGAMVATLDKELKERYSDEVLESRENKCWSLMTFSYVRKYLSDVDDSKRRSMAEVVFELFQDHVTPRIPSLQTGIIHGDCNGMNILVEKQASGISYQLKGLIDFGDTSKCCTIFDLGISLAYIMCENLSNPDVVDFVGPIIQGYHDVLPVSEEEFDLLYYLILARSIQSAIMGAHCSKSEPWNSYILVTVEKSWTLVRLLLDLGKKEVDKTWKAYVTLSSVRI